MWIKIINKLNTMKRIGGKKNKRKKESAEVVIK